jgi:GntR family transcriptional regulator
MEQNRDATIHRHSSVPLHAQLTGILRHKIVSKELLPGDQIPTEVELGKQYSLSRNTIRQAIEKLINEGYVYRDHGRGTFVSTAPKIHCQIGNLIEHRHLLALEGHTPRYEHIATSECDPIPIVAEKLRTQPGETVICARFVFLADEQPAIYVENYMLSKYLNNYADHVVSSGDNFYEFVELVTGKTIRHVVADIIPTVAKGEIAKILDMPPGVPLLELRELFVDTTNHYPLDFTLNYYHPEIIQFSVLKKYISDQ